MEQKNKMKIEKLKYVERNIHGVCQQVIHLNDPFMFDRINELIEEHNNNEIWCEFCGKSNLGNRSP